MLNIAKKIGLLVFITGFAVSTATAQSTTSSPYSRFGIGQPQKDYFVQSVGMGGISQGFRNFASINFANPASFSAIKLTSIDAGLFGGFTNLAKGTNAEGSYDYSISHLALAFPVSEKSGVSVGIVPLSNTGYQVINFGMVGNQDVAFLSTGEGGLSQFYLGAGYTIAENLSIGANLIYVFGNIKQRLAAEYLNDPETLNSRTTNNSNLGGLNIKLGIQYHKVLNEKDYLVIGYTGSANAKMDTRSDFLIERYEKNFLTDGENVLDTVEFRERQMGSATIPGSHTIGFLYQKDTKLTVGLDVNFTNWSAFKLNNNDPGFKNSIRVGAGLQYTPDVFAVTNYFNIVDYRLGINYNKSYLELNNKSINQVAVTGGLGLPILRSASKINLGLELGQRGTKQNNLVRERFAVFHLGVTFNDRWFVKRLFD